MDPSADGSLAKAQPPEDDDHHREDHEDGPNRLVVPLEELSHGITPSAYRAAGR
jgi:hypothetical protein